MVDIKKGIIDILDELKSTPLMIHSEADLQSLLYKELYKQDFREPTNYILNDDCLITNGVHCEYKQIDLVVFSKDHIKEINHDNKLLYAQNNLGWVFCDALIELKFENGEKSIPNQVKEDFFKLNNNASKFYIQYGKFPELFMVFYIFYWKQVKADNYILGLLNELVDLSIEKNIINFYVLIGPRQIWEPLLVDKNLIEKYGKFVNLSLDFTI